MPSSALHLTPAPSRPVSCPCPCPTGLPLTREFFSNLDPFLESFVPNSCLPLSLYSRPPRQASSSATQPSQFCADRSVIPYLRVIYFPIWTVSSVRTGQVPMGPRKLSWHLAQGLAQQPRGLAWVIVPHRAAGLEGRALVSRLCKGRRAPALASLASRGTASAPRSCPHRTVAPRIKDWAALGLEGV